MNKLGYAQSVECWDGNKLIGGLYGVHIKGCFFGESMFSKISNASKHCLLFLVSILIKYDYLLLDSQFYNPHLVQFGAYENSKYKREFHVCILRSNQLFTSSHVDCRFEYLNEKIVK